MTIEGGGATPGRPTSAGLHPKLRALLNNAAALPPTHLVPIEDTRRNGPARYQVGVPPDPVASIENRTIDGPAGPIALRIYRPDNVPDRPVTMFFHGGFVICPLDTHDGMCRQICHRSGTIVVSVDYRMAPEHPFPATPDDCLAALRWVAAIAGSFDGDPARLAVAGDSAGGNLTAVTALRARDGGGPPVKAQLLTYPVVDHYSAGHPSYAGRDTGFGLTGETMNWFWDLYLSDPAHASRLDASPLHADTLPGLPQAYVVIAGFDLLRDEGEAYARQLRHAGVTVEEARSVDLNHGLINWVGLINRSGEAMNAACAWLKRTL